MARQLRRKSESGYYHITIRGVNKQNIFESDNDRQKFLSIVARVKRECAFKLHAYCLMSNHVHLLIQDTDDCLAMIMKKISVSYAIYFNKKYDRSGHLFQDRFHSEPIDDDGYFLVALRYIHKNPEKAGISPINEYHWSSYRDYINGYGLADTEMALGLLGGKSKFIDFNAEDEQDRLSIKDMSDSQIIEYIKDTVKNVDFDKISNSLRNEKLRELKSMGFTNKKISEALKIGLNIINRA